MDSELIKMCDHPLIQDGWGPKCGDLLAYREGYEAGEPPSMLFREDGYGGYDVEHPEDGPMTWDRDDFIYIPP